jgi:transposase
MDEEEDGAAIAAVNGAHSHQHSHQHGAHAFSSHLSQGRRVEVIVGEAQRRRWLPEEKARITAESFASGANISAVARQNGVSLGLLHYWRRRAREVTEGTPLTFHAVRSAGADVGDETPVHSCAIEIAMADIRVRINGPVDSGRLAAALRGVRAST